jgi:hypothetical protein
MDVLLISKKMRIFILTLFLTVLYSNLYAAQCQTCNGSLDGRVGAADGAKCSEAGDSESWCLARMQCDPECNCVACQWNTNGTCSADGSQLYGCPSQ